MIPRCLGVAVALLAFPLGEALAYRDTRPFVARLFWEPQLSGVLVSPSGEWIAARAASGGRAGVLVQHSQTGLKKPAFATPDAIHHMLWVGDASLYVLHEHRDSGLLRTILRLRQADGEIEVERTRIGAPGYLVDALPHIDDEILWAVYLDGESRLFRGAVDDFRPGYVRPLSRRDVRLLAERAKPVASFDADWVYWLADSEGRARALLAIEGEGPEATASLRYREPGARRWREVWSGTVRGDRLIPIAFTSDDGRLIVAAHAGDNTLGLHEFDPEQGRLGRTLFSHPDYDVVDAVMDYDRREVIAAVYERDGARQHVYLNGFRDRHLRGIDALAPGETIEVTSSSRDHRYFTLLAHGPRNPGTFYFYDKQTGKHVDLGDVIRGLPARLLADVHSLEVTSADGTALEAFVALPEDGPAPPPLLVMPHGGPIDVRDDVSFDPLLQFLVIHGFAVLKVNYRGSSGYGKAFVEAGRRQWARGIEDDIDASVDEVLRRGWADPDRICIAGSSYGGYSALVSAIRRPDRYRCAASLNGPTDVPLLFQSSDFAATAAGRADFAEVVGDPDTELALLVEISPLYQAASLEVPVLIAHGSRDRRVDPDHAHRLRLMLDLLGKPYRWLPLHGSGHTPSLRQYETYAWELLDFLEENLPPSAPARGIPQSSGADSR